MPRDIQVLVKVYHLGTGAGTSQDFSTNADLRLRGGLLPLSQHSRALFGLDRLVTHECWVNADADVREGDKIVIDDIEYRAKHVDVHNYGGHPHLNIVLAKTRT